MATIRDYDLVITNGVCVTPSDIAPYDIAIKDEKIVLLAPAGSLSEASTRQLIDAEGGFVTVSPCKNDLKVVRLSPLPARWNRQPRPLAGA